MAKGFDYNCGIHLAKVDFAPSYDRTREVHKVSFWSMISQINGVSMASIDGSKKLKKYVVIFCRLHTPIPKFTLN